MRFEGVDVRGGSNQKKVVHDLDYLDGSGSRKETAVSEELTGDFEENANCTDQAEGPDGEAKNQPIGNEMSAMGAEVDRDSLPGFVTQVGVDAVKSLI
jgi:hypothetical protein